MATERIIAATAESPNDEQHNWSLRPTRLDEYIGQRDLVERIAIAVEACKQRGEPMEHVLLHGPPGLGKTTLAHVIAAEMGAKAFVTSGPALTKAADLVGALTRLEAGDVLFIDEIHRLPPAVEEFIYPAMEDFRVDITVEGGMHARTVSINGATTRTGMVSSPLRSRFGISHHLKHYSSDDILLILERSASLLGLSGVGEGTLEQISLRSRGTPRVANRLLRRVRDYAQVRSNGKITRACIDESLALEGVDHAGLDELDRAYMRVIATTYKGGPVGLEAVAATMSEDAGTLEDVIEPFLLQLAFVARTRRGRQLTKAGATHIGMPNAAPGSGELFDE